jgi:hypothetical protein
VARALSAPPHRLRWDRRRSFSFRLRPELSICNVIFGQFVSDFSCLFFGQPNNRTASFRPCGCSGLSVPNHPALASHSYKIACQDCRAGHRSDVDSFAVEYIADHDRPSSREAPRSKGCACWRAIARQFARSRYFPLVFSPSSTRRRMAPVISAPSHKPLSLLGRRHGR